ncbi:MAG: folate-binding protein [Burkholderiaceae bacterium]
MTSLAPLPHLGVIRALGDDAANFLHNQLTQDFALMGGSEARLAAFCTAKGRVLASFVAFKRGPGEILLVCHQDLLAPTLKRLSMFVLRAKVRLSDASAEFNVCGLIGAAVQQIAGSNLEPWVHTRQDEASVVSLYPCGTAPLALWIAPAGVDAPALDPVDVELWRYAQVQSGVVLVSAACSEAFVPQMLNYESVGGVNFKKGCYPGQEVVARSQFRGTLKRRAFLVRSASPMAAGDTLFMADDADQPCATVVQAAADPQGGFAAVVSGQITAMQTPLLYLHAADGPAAHTEAVPYPLLEDI